MVTKNDKKQVSPAAPPKILLFDLETSLQPALVFSLFNKYAPIPHDNLLQQRYILCAAWTWLDQKRVYSSSLLDDPATFTKDCHDDKIVVQKMSDVMAGADVVIGHNSDAFDLKYLRTRALFHGLTPVKPVVQLDTLKLARSQFYFNSNSLDSIGAALGVGRKSHTPRGLWIDCFQGDQSAMKKMVKYCKQDVNLLRDVYNKLAPHVDSKLNYNLFSDRPVCPSCGSVSVRYRGYIYTKSTTWRRVECKDCGHWSRISQAEHTKRTKSGGSNAKAA